MRFSCLILTLLLASALAQAEVTSIAQTSNGIVWIGSSTGLFQIAGGRSSRIAEGMFLSLAADGDHLWAGTNKGLFHCEKQHCQHDSRMQTAEIHLVAANAQRLYVATESQVFEILERKVVPIDVPSANIQSIAVDPGGTVWIATREAVARFHDGVYEKMLNDSAQTLAVGPNGDIWIGSGFLIYHWTKGKMNTLELSAPSANVRTMPPMKTLVAASDGTLWLGTTNGLLHWNGKGFQNILSNVEVTALYEDSSSVLWIGTSRGLLTRANGKIAEVPLATEFEN